MHVYITEGIHLPKLILYNKTDYRKHPMGVEKVHFCSPKNGRLKTVKYQAVRIIFFFYNKTVLDRLWTRDYDH